MISKTKYQIDEVAIKKLFEAAGIHSVTGISPLGAGEYNAVFSAKAGNKECAVKIAPSPNTAILTYEKSMMESEVFWYQQIQQHADIRIPEVYFTDFSKNIIPTDYFIMEKLPGKQIGQMKMSKAEKMGFDPYMARMAAEIHRIKNDRFGYIQNELYASWYQAIRSMAQALVHDCAAMGKTTKRGAQLIRYIDQYKSVLEKAECTMVNFDLGAHNVVCSRENGTVTYAWIDPERSFWGDRVADFVGLEMMKPLQKKKVSLEAYNAVSDYKITGTEEEIIRYAVAQGYLALIMETEKYYRYTRGNFGWWRNVGACKWLYWSAFKVLKK